MALKVIGTGWGRTGTDSMREALNMLGFGPCHHMFEVRASSEQLELWRSAAATTDEPDWEALFAGYSSCIDWPSAFYWRELVATYPEAHVILTARPADLWWESFSKTLLPLIEDTEDGQTLGATLVAARQLEGRPADRDHVIALYEAHVAEVKATVPPERLLVHNLGDGWEPLCAYLGVPMPDEPYPSRNSRSDFHERNAPDN